MVCSGTGKAIIYPLKLEPSSSSCSFSHAPLVTASLPSSKAKNLTPIGVKLGPISLHPLRTIRARRELACRAAEYKFPDPIPEFADTETEKFRAHLLKRLSTKEEVFGDSVEEVVDVCTEILSTFLRTEYGGPGTLLVEPFIDMADTVNERGLPGGSQAARAAVKWGQTHIDNDWKEWTAPIRRK